jgi:UDP-glucose 4-epimerase
MCDFMMKILITGSSGFIGSHLIDNLSTNNKVLYCLYNTHSNNFKRNNIYYIQQDFNKPLDISKLPLDIDCIIHLAANVDKKTGNSELFRINTVSTLNLLEYGKTIGIKKFVFASTGGVYGYHSHPLQEESAINPIDFYSLSKYESEILVNHYSQYFSTIILRFFFPYGMRQYTSIIPSLVNKIKNKEKIIVYNDKNPKINPIYITDVIDIIYESMSLDGQHTLNVAGDNIISIKELSNLIGKHMKSKPVFEYLCDTNIIDLVGDNTKIKNIVGFTPKISLEEGIQNYISWLELNK